MVDDKPFDNRRVQIGGTEGFLGEWGAEEDSPKWTLNSISLRDALVHGRNSATMYVAERVGMQAVKDVTTKAGVSSPL